MTKLETLAALARKATPGPWNQLKDGPYFDDYNSENLAYVAVIDPATVLRLIAIVEAAMALRADLTYRSGHIQAFDAALFAFDDERAP